MLACVIARTKYACAGTHGKRNIRVLSFLIKRKIIVLCHFFVL